MPEHLVPIPRYSVGGAFGGKFPEDLPERVHAHYVDAAGKLVKDILLVVESDDPQDGEIPWEKIRFWSAS